MDDPEDSNANDATTTRAHEGDRRDELRATRSDSSTRDLSQSDSVSDAHEMKSRMRAAHEAAKRVDRTSEDGSRLHGLLAVLALPARRQADGVYRRPVVEVEIQKHPSKWAAVENLVIDADGMTFFWGTNGSTVQYRFPGRTCPAWRMP